MFYNWLCIDTELPEHLTPEETICYFKQYRSGDDSARERIILCNIKLVLDRIKAFKYYPYDKQELTAAGLEGLAKSIYSFDISRGINFSVYATKFIDTEIYRFIRGKKKHSRFASLEHILETIEKERNFRYGPAFIDRGADFVSNHENKELYSTIRELVNSLPDREREIIMLYFGFNSSKGLKEREIAEKLGISRSSVAKLKGKSLTKISTQLQKLGLIELPRNRIVKRRQLKK